MTRRGVWRPPAWASWTPWVLTLLLVIGHVALLPGDEIDEDRQLGPLSVLLTVQALTFATVGLVIARALPRHSVAWLFMAVGVLVSLYLAAGSYQHHATVVRAGGLPMGEATAWLASWLYVPALGVFVLVLPQVFPTGHPVSRRWRLGLWVAGAAVVAMVVSGALEPGRLSQSTLQNPFGIAPAHHELLDEAASTTYLVAALVAFGSLVARWRAAGTQERQQLKWFCYFAALLPVFVVGNGVLEVTGVGEPLATLLPMVLAVPTFLGLPVATAVSVLRYRLYDIDLVINRTLVYGALTATLVGFYLASVLVFRFVLSPLTGESDLAVAGSTLAVAGLFRPVRSRIQSVVDRRFYRARYDAARTLEGFSARLRDELDIETLDCDLRRVVDDTMTPTRVSLWLRAPS